MHAPTIPTHGLEHNPTIPYPAYPLTPGIKRAYKIKDFSAIIPGHGGVFDRIDCQLIMGLFTFIYYSTFVEVSGAPRHSHARHSAQRAIATASPTHPPHPRRTRHRFR